MRDFLQEIKKQAAEWDEAFSDALDRLIHADWWMIAFAIVLLNLSAFVLVMGKFYGHQ